MLRRTWPVSPEDQPSRGDSVILLILTVRMRMGFQKKSDGSAKIGLNNQNRNQNRPYQTIIFPFSTRVLPPSLRDKPRSRSIDRCVRPPGFEPGFLPYGCRPEAVRPVLAGLRRADAHVPVLDQTRLRPHPPTEAHLIAKALTFPALLLRHPILKRRNVSFSGGQSNRFDFLNCKRQYGHLG